MKRYSKIIKKYPREFLLLQGTGCKYKKCTYCDYYLDVSEEPFLVNFPIIEKVTGEFGVLDFINSGSAVELDSQTLMALKSKIIEKNISTIWCEAHWIYRDHLKKFSENFRNSEVKYRIGVETFNENLRKNWQKGMENTRPEEIAKYFQAAILLVGIKGQKIDDIRRDIEIAEKHFERYIVNVFIENSTSTQVDDDLKEEFKNEFLEYLTKNPKAELLLQNTDFGVG